MAADRKIDYIYNKAKGNYFHRKLPQRSTPAPAAHALEKHAHFLQANVCQQTLPIRPRRLCRENSQGSKNVHNWPWTIAFSPRNLNEKPKKGFGTESYKLYYVNYGIERFNSIRVSSRARRRHPLLPRRPPDCPDTLASVAS